MKVFSKSEFQCLIHSKKMKDEARFVDFNSGSMKRTWIEVTVNVKGMEGKGQPWATASPWILQQLRLRWRKSKFYVFYNQMNLVISKLNCRPIQRIEFWGEIWGKIWLKIVKINYGLIETPDWVESPWAGKHNVEAPKSDMWYVLGLKRWQVSSKRVFY